MQARMSKKVREILNDPKDTKAFMEAVLRAVHSDDWSAELVLPSTGEKLKICNALTGPRKGEKD